MVALPLCMERACHVGTNVQGDVGRDGEMLMTQGPGYI